MLAPVLHILPLATIIRERVLPVVGKVNMQDVVAQKTAKALSIVSSHVGVAEIEMDCKPGNFFHERLKVGYRVKRRSEVFQHQGKSLICSHLYDGS